MGEYAACAVWSHFPHSRAFSTTKQHRLLFASPPLLTGPPQKVASPPWPLLYPTSIHVPQLPFTSCSFGVFSVDPFLVLELPRLH